MKPNLEIILNGNLVIEYPRSTRLPGKQRGFLDIMDFNMDEGINLEGEIIDSPDKQQRSRYVSMKLFQALKSNNKGLITASCAYLVNRQPELLKIKANEEGDTVILELVFE